MKKGKREKLLRRSNSFPPYPCYRKGKTVSGYPPVPLEKLNQQIRKVPDQPWIEPVKSFSFFNKKQYYNNNHQSRKTIICSNCRKKGHYQRQCLKPIQSYGIIALKKNFKEETHVLLIRRKHSIGFETFLRGSYKSQEEIYSLIERMTSPEKIKMKTMSFDELWENICVNHDSYFYRHGKKQAKEKFDRLDIHSLFENTDSPWKEPAWEFPKGRRQLHEEDKDCAIREFAEETNYTPGHYRIITRKVFVETYMGTNHIQYRHNYFLAWMHSNAPDPIIDPTNRDQIAEIGDIGWFPIEDAINKMKPYNMEKKQVLKDAYQYMLRKKRSAKWNTRPKKNIVKNQDD